MVSVILQTILFCPDKLDGQVWEALPNDIVMCIARCADSSQLASLRLVNKHWRSSCDSIISRVSISNTAVQRFGSSSNALEKVTRRFPNLQSLVLWKLHAGATYLLPRLMKLTLLDLGGTMIDDDSLKHISFLTKLKTLQLWETRIGDQGLQYLSNLVGLSSLSLRDSHVKDEGMRHVARLTNLTSLDLDRTHVGNAGMRRLSTLKKLQRLSLWRTQVGDDGMVSLSQLTNLVKLNVGLTRVTTDSLEILSSLTMVTSLELWGIKTNGQQQQQAHLQEDEE